MKLEDLKGLLSYSEMHFLSSISQLGLSTYLLAEYIS